MVPFVKPATTIGLVVPLPDRLVLPALQVAVYPLIGEDPVLDGAKKDIDNEPSRTTAEPMVGALGDWCAGVVGDAFPDDPQALRLVPRRLAKQTARRFVDIAWVMDEPLCRATD